MPRKPSSSAPVSRPSAPAASDPSPDDPDRALAPIEAVRRSVPADRGLVVAVSGGSDSMGLLRLAADVFRGRIIAATVDHGLRPESLSEAEQVGAWCRAIGVPHAVLAWQGPKPKTGIQAAARAARYRLLAEHCRSEGASGRPHALLTAHTEDDQLETFLMRLAHGSDVEGLGAIREQSEIEGAPPVPLVRPLLAVSRLDLRKDLARRSQPFLDDPSNEDRRFERVRVRSSMGALCEVGLTRERLARAVRVFGTVRDLTAAAVRSAALDLISVVADGSLRLDRAGLLSLAPALGRRVLRRALLAVGGDDYAPREASLANLLERLGEDAFRGASLAGCLLAPAAGGAKVTVRREARAAARQDPLALCPGETVLFDRRFFVRAPFGGSGSAGGGLTLKSDAQGAPRLLAGTLDVPLHYIDPADPRPSSGDAPVALFVGLDRLDGRLEEGYGRFQTFAAKSGAAEKDS